MDCQCDGKKKRKAKGDEGRYEKVFGRRRGHDKEPKRPVKKGGKIGQRYSRKRGKECAWLGIRRF